MLKMELVCRWQLVCNRPSANGKLGSPSVWCCHLDRVYSVSRERREIVNNNVRAEPRSLTEHKRPVAVLIALHVPILAL